MYEVELKVPAQLDCVRDRLESLGATKRGRVVQEDTYYDAPHRSFPETDEALRLRRERGAEVSTLLTYKGPLLEAESKSREEVEIGVSDGDAAETLLQRLGFEPAASVRKERERYELDGYTVSLDAVDDVGEYVEVETEIASSELTAARREAVELLERLALDPDDHVRTSYLELKLDAVEG